MPTHENKLIAEIELLQTNFTKTTDKLVKDVKRQDKIMARSDKRQQKEYDELMALKIEIEETQKEVVFTMGAIGESRSKETGYPNKTSGEDIHIYGRITALADVFDALGSARVYKSAWDDEKIFKMFKEERGEHFDPNLIDIFFEHLDEFLKIRDSMKDVTQD